MKGNTGFIRPPVSKDMEVMPLVPEFTEEGFQILFGAAVEGKAFFYKCKPHAMYYDAFFSFCCFSILICSALKVPPMAATGHLIAHIPHPMHLS